MPFWLTDYVRGLGQDVATLEIGCTGSITLFWVKQKPNIIMTLVEIITFCVSQNIIRMYNFAG